MPSGAHKRTPEVFAGEDIASVWSGSVELDEIMDPIETAYFEAHEAHYNAAVRAWHAEDRDAMYLALKLLGLSLTGHKVHDLTENRVHRELRAATARRLAAARA